MTSTEHRQQTQQRPQPQQGGFGAGSEGWDGTEDPSRPVTSSNPQPDPEKASAAPREIDEPMQSDYALSQSADDRAEDGRYSVAEEQNFDQQSEASRRVGRMPQDATGAEPADGMKKSMQRQPGDGKDGDADNQDALKEPTGRSVPPGS
jgi:hypothetical protein